MEFRILFSLWIWAFLVLKIAGVLNSQTPSVHQRSDGPSLSSKYGEVQFNVSFNLANWTNYEKFIQDLRRKVEFQGSHGNISVLHPEEKMPTKFFDVILKVNESDPTSRQVTLKIRQDNLYLVGFKNARDHWLEFNKSSSNRLITGSTFLEFNDSYNSLEKKAGKGREDICIGKDPFKQAVIDLAKSTDIQERARGLIIVIQMISESMRFRNISTFLSNESGNPRPGMIKLQNSWGDISEELLHSDACYNHKFKPPHKETKISSEEDAAKAIGVIKYSNFSRCKCGSK